MVETGATHAHRSRFLHDQEITRAGAGRAGPVVQRRDHDEIGWSAPALDQPLALRLGQLR